MTEEKRGHFLKVGGRTWKTVLVVFLSLLIDSRRQGAYPFYAAIAGIICIQKNTGDSMEMAVNREIATLIGGFAGMGFLFVEKAFGGFPNEVLRYGAISLCLIPIISLVVWISRKKAVFLTCVVFLCVLITHGEDVHPFWFAINRIVDTTIGIVLALIINTFPDIWGKFAKKHLDHTDEKE